MFFCFNASISFLKYLWSYVFICVLLLYLLPCSLSGESQGWPQLQDQERPRESPRRNFLPFLRFNWILLRWHSKKETIWQIKMKNKIFTKVLMGQFCRMSSQLTKLRWSPIVHNFTLITWWSSPRSWKGKAEIESIAKLGDRLNPLRENSFYVHLLQIFGLVGRRLAINAKNFAHD